MARHSTIGDDPLDALLPRDGQEEPREEPGPRAESAPTGGEPRDPTPSPRASAPDGPPLAESGQYLTFLVGDELYAISILRVREILELGSVTRVPHCPPWVRGVMNLRGSVVPVVDLTLRIGLPVEEEGQRRCIVVVEVGTGVEPAVVGAVVDGVREVTAFGPEDIRSVPAFGTQIGPQYLTGMAEIDGELALLIDARRLLSRREMHVALQAADSAEGAQEDRGEPEAAEEAGAEPLPDEAMDASREAEDPDHPLEG